MGKKEGLRPEVVNFKGRAENTIIIAEKLIKKGISVVDIEEATGLPMEKLQQIADRIGLKLVMN